MDPCPIHAASKLLEHGEALRFEDTDQRALVRRCGKPRAVKVEANARQVAFVRVEHLVLPQVIELYRTATGTLGGGAKGEERKRESACVCTCERERERERDETRKRGL